MEVKSGNIGRSILDLYVYACMLVIFWILELKQILVLKNMWKWLTAY